MKKISETHPTTTRTLDTAELQQVTGGYDYYTAFNAGQSLTSSTTYTSQPPSYAYNYASLTTYTQA
jgi:bacteriocin-like protein